MLLLPTQLMLPTFPLLDCWNGVKDMILVVYGNNDETQLDVGGVPVQVRHFHQTPSKKNTPVSG
jgi:hypothetical protein